MTDEFEPYQFKSRATGSTLEVAPARIVHDENEWTLLCITHGTEAWYPTRSRAIVAGRQGGFCPGCVKPANAVPPAAPDERTPALLITDRRRGRHRFSVVYTLKGSERQTDWTPSLTEVLRVCRLLKLRIDHKETWRDDEA